MDHRGMRAWPKSRAGEMVGAREVSPFPYSIFQLSGFESLTAPGEVRTPNLQVSPLLLRWLCHWQ